MAIFDELFGKEEKEVDQLANLVPGETDSLDNHAKLCALRYKTLADRAYATNQKLRSQNRLIWLILALLIANKIIDLSQIAAVAKLFV
jgi:hypothetical protein